MEQNHSLDEFTASLIAFIDAPSAKNARMIRESYPEDQAIGYGIDELRGVFVVEMEKSVKTDG